MPFCIFCAKEIGKPDWPDHVKTHEETHVEIHMGTRYITESGLLAILKGVNDGEKAPPAKAAKRTKAAN
jgi:hypothetical protein